MRLKSGIFPKASEICMPWTAVNVVLCLAGSVLFAFGLGAISNAVLKKTSLV